jgi:hypothetical protein
MCVTALTHDHIKQLKLYKERQGQLTKQTILGILRPSPDAPISPSFIKKLLDQKAQSELSKQTRKNFFTAA